MKVLLIGLLTLSLIGCAREDGQKQEIVTLKIISIEKESTEWGCIGTDYKIMVEIKEKGFRTEMCGNLGEVGETFKGCFVTNSFDAMNDGLKRYCTN